MFFFIKGVFRYLSLGGTKQSNYFNLDIFNYLYLGLVKRSFFFLTSRVIGPVQLNRLSIRGI